MHNRVYKAGTYLLYAHTTPKFMPIIVYVHFVFALAIVLILSNVQL